jgi:hypothetical protein
LNDPQDALEMSLINNANIPHNEYKKEMDTHFETIPSDEKFIESSYGVLEMKDEELPFEYRPLPSELRFEFLDDSGKFPRIINSTLSGV